MIRFEQTVDLGKQHTVVEISDDADFTEFLNAVIAFALALSFHPDTVRENLGEMQ